MKSLIPSLARIAGVKNQVSAAVALVGCLGLSVSAPAGAASSADRPESQSARLAAWYRAVGSRLEGETFGGLVARAAALQRGKPYSNPRDTGEPESLQVGLASFHCVSFLESSLAVARCIWKADPSESCFLREVESQRYRNGKESGYGSRLHYLDDWISDNASRRRLLALTAGLGGTPEEKSYFYMSRHPWRYPALGSAALRADIEAAEARLSASRPLVVGGEKLAQAQDRLQEGDIVAFATTKPGILLTHAGFVVRGRDGKAHLLHASSHHRRVVLTSRDLTAYVQRRPERRGIVVARPLAPPARY